MEETSKEIRKTTNSEKQDFNHLNISCEENNRNQVSDIIKTKYFLCNVLAYLLKKNLPLL